MEAGGGACNPGPVATRTSSGAGLTTSSSTEPNPNPLLDTQPSEPQLLRVTKKILPHWEDVCVFLDIPHQNIYEAKQNNINNVSQACFAALLWWRSGNCQKEVTWRVLLEAMREADCTTQADEVEERVCTELWATGTGLSSTPAPGADAAQKQAVAGETKAFAVITANETEQKVVRHFLKLFEDAGEVWTDAESCDYTNDVYLKQQGVKVKYKYTETDNVESSYDFEVFTLSTDEKQVIGIHVKCLQQAAETKGGSRNTTRRLLKFAHERKWKLEIIFSVGCCMLSADDKSSENAREMMGRVLLSNVYEAFLERGKVEGKGDKDELIFHSQFYEGAREWVSRLQEHIITEPSKRGDPKTFRKIPVKEVPRFLCGPLVVKSADFGDNVRGNASIVGIEMEGSGIASALSDWKDDGNTVPKFLLLKGVSDFGEKKGDDLEAMFFNEPTKEAVSDDVRQQIATFHCIALVVRGMAAHYLCTRRPSDGV